MITDPIENPDPRWSHMRVLRGTATTTATAAPRFRKGQGATRTATPTVAGLRVSLTLPCNDAGSVVQ